MNNSIPFDQMSSNETKSEEMNFNNVAETLTENTRH